MAEIPLPLKLQGMHASPYTRKMLGVLRYRRLPYRFIIGMPTMEDMPGSGDRSKLPIPKVPLLPTFYLPDEDGEIQAVTDSTPLIRRFEAAFTERSVIPADPVMAFLNYILEDYADEWLTRCMFHYRWYHDADIKKAGELLPLYGRVDIAAQPLATFQQQFTKRQVERLYVVGSSETTAPVIEASYLRFLKLMDAHLQGQQFLLGNRPASADFAMMGQLTSLTHFDPTPMALSLETSPRTYVWVERMEDLCGYEVEASDWTDNSAIPDTLLNLLREVARTHQPQLLANAQALTAGEKHFETRIDDCAWSQPSFPYQGKCLQWIRAEFSALSDSAQSRAREILSATGLLPLIEAVL